MNNNTAYMMILGLGMLIQLLSGCEEKKETDLTDWSLPNLEEKHGTFTDDASGEDAGHIKPGPGPVTYKVRSGDTLYGIAARHNVSPRRLAEANGLVLSGPGSVIHPGQEIIIP